VIESPSGRIRKGIGFPFPAGGPTSVLSALVGGAAAESEI